MVIHRQTTGGFQESQGANVESVQNSENGLSSSYVVLLHPEFAENLDPSAREWPCGARFNRAPLELDTKVFFVLVQLQTVSVILAQAVESRRANGVADMPILKQCHIHVSKS